MVSDYTWTTQVPAVLQIFHQEVLLQISKREHLWSQQLAFPREWMTFSLQSPWTSCCRSVRCCRKLVDINMEHQRRDFRCFQNWLGTKRIPETLQILWSHQTRSQLVSLCTSVTRISQQSSSLSQSWTSTCFIRVQGCPILKGTSCYHWSPRYTICVLYMSLSCTEHKFVTDVFRVSLDSRVTDSTSSQCKPCTRLYSKLLIPMKFMRLQCVQVSLQLQLLYIYNIVTVCVVSRCGCWRNNLLPEVSRCGSGLAHGR